jgi:hypothetical protein
MIAIGSKEQRAHEGFAAAVVDESVKAGGNAIEVVRL